MLMSNESTSVKTRDEIYLETLGNSLLFSDIPNFDAEDRLYVDEWCSRCSFVVKNEIENQLKISEIFIHSTKLALLLLLVLLREYY